MPDEIKIVFRKCTKQENRLRVLIATCNSLTVLKIVSNNFRSSLLKDKSFTFNNNGQFNGKSLHIKLTCK